MRVEPKICALPGCGKYVGIAPYRIAGKPEDFCSRQCVDSAWGTKLSKLKKKQEVAVEVPANDFGDAGVVRHLCDRPECRKPIALCYKGRTGEYCSKNCLEISEKENTTMTDTNDTTATSPIAAGAPAPKKAKKASAKKAPAKKAAPKKEAKAPKVSTNGDEYTPRPGTKFEILLNMVKKAKGATTEELATAVGWEKSAIGAGIFNLRKHNLNIQVDENGRFHLIP